MNESLVAEKKRTVDDALQDLFCEMYGPGIVTDWMVTCEMLNSKDDLMLYIALSSNCTAWKIRGMSYMSSKMIHELTNGGTSELP